MISAVTPISLMADAIILINRILKNNDIRLIVWRSGGTICWYSRIYNSHVSIVNIHHIFNRLVIISSIFRKLTPLDPAQSTTFSSVPSLREMSPGMYFPGTAHQTDSPAVPSQGRLRSRIVSLTWRLIGRASIPMVSWWLIRLYWFKTCFPDQVLQRMNIEKLQCSINIPDPSCRIVYMTLGTQYTSPLRWIL